MKNFFTILGGMGTFASMNFEQILNESIQAQKDQDYFDYLLVNHASVPDRSSYILDHHNPSFYPALAQDISQQNLLKPQFIVMACNTAHYFYPQLQKLTNIPILHMPFLVAMESVELYPQQKSFGLLATKGTLHDQVYEKCFNILGKKIVLPSDSLADRVMNFIYRDVKDNNQISSKIFNDILNQARDELGVPIIILGCTELSYAADVLSIHEGILDSQLILVQRTLELAQYFRSQSDKVAPFLNKYKEQGDQNGLLMEID